MPVTARVILLAGPSGCGKSTIATALGLPTLQLDDFYRDGADPALPRDDAGLVDWDHPDSWFADQALAAIERLAGTGSAEVPVYRIDQDGRVGTRVLDLAEHPVFVAEGLFADQLVDACREAGVLADAIVLTPSGARTFFRRFSRDLVESRKPPTLLLRRGLRLWQAHRAVISRCLAQGMRPSSNSAARTYLQGLMTIELTSSRS